jgi:hypothetical protein
MLISATTCIVNIYYSEFLSKVNKNSAQDYKKSLFVFELLIQSQTTSLRMWRIPGDGLLSQPPRP